VEIDLSRAVWHKSTFSNGNGGNCVEVARNLPNVVAVRDTKNPDGPQLVISPAAWRDLTASLRAGRQDLG
jgi:hypothetical protein